MSQLVIRRAAELDIEEATDWYEQEEAGLGTKFVNELVSTFTRVRRMPLQFPSVGRSVRRALLGRFPYAIYFVLRDEDQAVIIAVLHQRRDPATWRQRARGERR